MAKLGTVTHQAEPLEKCRGMKKNRTTLELGPMMWLDNIWLDSSI